MALKRTPKEQEKVDLIKQLFSNISNLNDNDLNVIQQMINKGHDDVIIIENDEVKSIEYSNGYNHGYSDGCYDIESKYSNED